MDKKIGTQLTASSKTPIGKAIHYGIPIEKETTGDVLFNKYTPVGENIDKTNIADSDMPEEGKIPQITDDIVYTANQFIVQNDELTHLVKYSVATYKVTIETVIGENEATILVVPPLADGPIRVIAAFLEVVKTSGISGDLTFSFMNDTEQRDLFDFGDGVAAYIKHFYDSHTYDARFLSFLHFNIRASTAFTENGQYDIVLIYEYLDGGVYV